MKIISGGQTGVDRAALDAAIAAGFPIGGWCPKGRKAEDGVIDRRYALTETPLAGYAQRTEWNVRDSDGTLIFYRTKIKGGTLLTLKTAERYGSPCWCIDLGKSMLTELPLRGPQSILNIAGSRESEAPGIYEQVFEMLKELLLQEALLYRELPEIKKR